MIHGNRAAFSDVLMPFLFASCSTVLPRDQRQPSDLGSVRITVKAVFFFGLGHSFFSISTIIKHMLRRSSYVINLYKKNILYFSLNQLVVLQVYRLEEAFMDKCIG